MYEWIKALHVIAVISWMAGMLYLPRLFVYHCEAERGSKQSETFKVMERLAAPGDHQPRDDSNLARRTVSGLGRAWYCAAVSRQVFAGGDPVGACTAFLLAALRICSADKNLRSQRLYRIINEVPTILMILIVILVIVKPFG